MVRCPDGKLLQGSFHFYIYLPGIPCFGIPWTFGVSQPAESLGSRAEDSDKRVHESSVLVFGLFRSVIHPGPASLTT